MRRGGEGGWERGMGGRGVMLWIGWLSMFFGLFDGGRGGGGGGAPSI